MNHLLDSIKSPDFIRDLAITIVFLKIGSVFVTKISDWFNENFDKTPERLVGLLKSNKIEEFTDLRKQINIKIEFDGINLSGKNLKYANQKH